MVGREGEHQRSPSRKTTAGFEGVTGSIQRNKRKKKNEDLFTFREEGKGSEEKKQERKVSLMNNQLNFKNYKHM